MLVGVVEERELLVVLANHVLRGVPSHAECFVVVLSLLFQRDFRAEVRPARLVRWSVVDGAGPVSSGVWSAIVVVAVFGRTEIVR